MTLYRAKDRKKTHLKQSVQCQEDKATVLVWTKIFLYFLCTMC